MGQSGPFVLDLFFALPWACVSDGRFCEVDASGIAPGAPGVADLAEDIELVWGVACWWELFLERDKGNCVGAIC
jgi:hypothetical protein